MYAKFAVNEAKLVLPIFEAQYPDDGRPRRTILIIEKWLRDPNFGVGNCRTDISISAASIVADYSADCSADYFAGYTYAADAAYAAACAVAIDSVYSVYNVAYAAYYVRLADPSITLIDQLRRLFIIMREAE